MCRHEKLSVGQETMMRDHPMNCAVCGHDYFYTGPFVYDGHAMWQGKVVDVFTPIEQICECPSCHSEAGTYLEECTDQESPKPITCEMLSQKVGLSVVPKYDLDSCHFCHSTNVASLHVNIEGAYHDHYFVRCLNCKAHGPESDTEEKAVRLWNVKSGEINEMVTA